LTILRRGSNTTKNLSRTADEYRNLMQIAGFQMTHVIPTASPFSLVEAAPS
jgi:hypothetical protein